MALSHGEMSVSILDLAEVREVIEVATLALDEIRHNGHAMDVSIADRAMNRIAELLGVVSARKDTELTDATLPTTPDDH